MEIKIFLLCILSLLFLTTTTNAEQYSRDNWGTWASHNGITTRGQILIRDGKIDNRTGDRYWVCPYTGKRLDSVSDVDIDHVVSLKEAHMSGGESWSPKKRFNFANDFDNLLAVYD